MNDKQTRAKEGFKVQKLPTRLCEQVFTEKAIAYEIRARTRAEFLIRQEYPNGIKFS